MRCSPGRSGASSCRSPCSRERCSPRRSPVKLFAATALVAAVGLLVGFRAERRLAIGWLAGGLAVGVALAAIHASSLGAIWDDAVRFHEEAREYSVSLDSNADRLAEVFVRSGLVYFWLVVAGLLVWLLRRARPRLLAPALALWASLRLRSSSGTGP